MPKESKDRPNPDVEEHVLKTRHVFLDTEAYRSYGHNPSHDGLKALSQIIKDNAIALHITDITLAEVKRQIEEMIDADSTQIKKGLKPYKKWKFRYPKIAKDKAPTFDKAGLKAAAFSAFTDAVKKDWQAKTHYAAAFPAMTIFQRYFQRQPPFAATNSKEFPDAFVVATLEKWCADNSEKMYVITHDKAFQDAATETGVLLPLPGLESLIKLTAVPVSDRVTEEAQQLLSGKPFIMALGEKLKKSLANVSYEYDGPLAEGEVTDAELVGDVAVSEFSIISVSESHIGALVYMTAPFEFDVDYEDYSNAMYDREDGVHFGVESTSTKVEENIDLLAFVSVPRDGSDNITVELLTNEIKATGHEEEVW